MTILKLFDKILYQYPDHLGKLYIKATKYFKSREH